jgi:hypothetical protein
VVTIVAGPCTITVGGSTTSNFDENKGGGGVQNLNLKGSGLVVKSASFLCLGAYSVGSAITMNSVSINVGSVAGAIDFRDN